MGVGIILCSISLDATDINTKKDSSYGSYNYVALGFESIHYEEVGTRTSTGKNFISSATADSPVYLSGSLTKMNETYDFSIDAISTLLPTQAAETWHEDGELASTDTLELLVSSIKILGQYKKTNNHRIASGIRYDLNLYKRHTFLNVDGSSAASDGTLSEEKVATLSLMGGYIYESSPFSNGNYRYKFSALAGKPLWRNATNTGFKDVSYDSTTGYSYEVGGYFGYQVIKGLEVGIFADYDYQIKIGGDRAVTADGTILWPENTLKVFRSGMSLVWNFN